MTTATEDDMGRQRWEGDMTGHSARPWREGGRAAEGYGACE